VIDVVVGGKIPLNLQVFDGNPNLSVTAALIDKHGKEFFRVTLSHLSNGLYVNFDLEMPEVDLLIAQYETSKQDDYELSQDIFKAIPKARPIEKMIVGEVVSEKLWDDEQMIIGEAHAEKET
jgi:hypothetical protein